MSSKEKIKTNLAGVVLPELPITCPGLDQKSSSNRMVLLEFA
jgi:hypothetical protein